MRIDPELIKLAWKHPQFLLAHQQEIADDVTQANQLKTHDKTCDGGKACHA